MARAWFLTFRFSRSRARCLAQPIHAECDVHAMETVLGQHPGRGVRTRHAAVEWYGEPLHVSIVMSLTYLEQCGMSCEPLHVSIIMNLTYFERVWPVM